MINGKLYKTDVEIMIDLTVVRRQELEEFIKKGKEKLSKIGYQFAGFSVEHIGGTVYLKYRNYKSTIETKAQCHPSDKFDKVLGKAIAMKRMLDLTGGWKNER